MDERRLLIGDVPTRVYVPTGAPGLLLLGHGGAHSKDADRFVGLCRYFAERTGLAVVCIDAVDHGERRPTGATDDLPRAWHSRTAPRMAADWAQVVDELAPMGPAVAYVGFSMGAIFGIPTVGALPTVRATVFVAGGIPGDDWTHDADLAGLLFDGATRLGHTNVLMLAKEEDEVFSADGVQLLYDAVVARSKELVTTPGNHDDWGPDLLDRAARFITDHC